MLYWEVQKGTDGPNQFGEDPLGGSGFDSGSGYDDGDYATSSIPRVDG